MKFPRVSNIINWAGRRGSLWVLLMVLVLTLLGILVWLAGRYESSLVQGRLERNAAETVTDIRSGLARNLHTFQALQFSERRPESWQQPAAEVLRGHREIMRLEWRSETLELLSFVDTPFRTSVFERLGRDNLLSDVNLTCTTARRLNGAAYSISYFLPQPDGLGMEVFDMCMPIVLAGQLTGYTVATYSLQDILGELVGPQLARGVALSFTEADGTRLALHGAPSRGNRVYVAQQLLDLPGATLVLRMESRLGTPALFPNFLTALVMAMALALLAVLFLLARDMRRRLKVEHDLGEALAFRKAMENSVLTGLRARDLKGRITYVNPAFCKMVGVEAGELLNQSFPSPYWPPELAGIYQERQEIRLAGNSLPREGHESVFMRRDGTRFPVLIMEAPLINAVGKHTGWVSAILDVSEQRRIEELSRASQDRLQATARLAMVGEMASLLSHELNQPLAAISSYATGSLNLLRGEMAAPGRPAEDLAPPLFDDLQLAMGRIAEQAERAGKVIKSVHDFVRRRERVREAVAPRSLLDAVMPLVILQSRKLGVRVVIELAPDCPAVLCDRTMVEQVLLNLSRNGMQAMQGVDDLPSAGLRGKVLTLRIRPAAGHASSRWIEFAVIDCGEGISEKVAEQLFTPFFTTKEEGMGLGLSLCRTVIEQHGGFLAYAAAPPRGTIFSFTLPAAGAPDATAAPQNF
ncbi:two-component system, LuxR family, sensor histidine kinase DctS [Polaromonas sp. OV174]|uniref:two-component system sensor histidine kinase NtrB n=1 Tax=Polaromonas sp. OV174 TaxID=1855300 RepID=UPI0008E6F9CF|nr:ATP-binding protein [Polaromonas sp. OV174]SFC30004.1 two-component system, LuxR family, sensor histidine kinase DctS [Polaromonas sp. OV174]